ncbi:sensor histidine kinase [Pseudonocardia nantongensis]|uniref:sensor histidine kinase n=1 Tax=Pseudonocardia nantongensis TaxID=1181885 RepID=UPI00397C990E
MPVSPAVTSAALVVAVGVTGWLFSGDWTVTDTAGVLRVLLGLVGMVTIPWRYRYPWEFAVLGVVFAAFAPLASYLPLVGVFVVATRRRPFETVAITVLSMAGAAYTMVSEVPDPTGMWVALLGAWTLQFASVAAGLLAGTRRAVIADLRGRLATAEAERAERDERARAAERRRIAGEMHDLLGHRLSLLSVHAGALELRSDLSADTVRESARVLRDTTHRAMEDLRTIVQVLREPVGDDPVLDPPGEGLGGIESLVAEARAAGAEIRLRSTELLLLTPPPDPLAGVAYRVVREGLTNATRHAPGAAVEVRLDGRPGRDLAVTVTSGCTGDRPPAPVGAGTGLIGLRERVETLTGGTLAHGPLPDGYRLRAVLPWRKENR